MPRGGCVAVAGLVLLGGACTNDAAGARDDTAVAVAQAGPTPDAPVPPSPSASATPAPIVASEHVQDPVPTRPAWLGTRELPRRPDGFGQVLATPVELADRRLPPPASPLPDPPADAGFAATVEAVPADVLARSTWHDGCPVHHADLRYVTLTFWGFDERPHTGELLVHADTVDDVVAAFEAAYAARFPIEQMRVVAPAELDAPATGDGNNTTSFVCRATRGSSSWSAHASGMAVDVNPFHNPYHRDDLVLPELASAYLHRTHDRPGMLQVTGPVVTAFDAVGWAWGGRWTRPIDYMHFSLTGR